MHDKTATITPRNGATAGDGNPVPASGTDIEDVPCALRAMSSSEAELWGRSAHVQVFDFFCEPIAPDGSALTIGHDDQITVGGVVYKALGPSEDQGGRSNVLRTPVERAYR